MINWLTGAFWILNFFLKFVNIWVPQTQNIFYHRRSLFTGPQVKPLFKSLFQFPTPKIMK